MQALHELLTAGRPPAKAPDESANDGTLTLQQLEELVEGKKPAVRETLEKAGLMEGSQAAGRRSENNPRIPNVGVTAKCFRAPMAAALVSPIQLDHV